MHNVVNRRIWLERNCRRTDKIGDTLPRFFVMLGRAHAQRVETAMDVGVFVFVIIADDIEHGARLLGAGGAVKVNQRMTVHALPQNRKIFAER